jgi:hypothetical protein
VDLGSNFGIKMRMNVSFIQWLVITVGKENGEKSWIVNGVSGRNGALMMGRFPILK